MPHPELPSGRYLTCTWEVKPDAGGQTRAMLMRNRMVHDAGIMPGILSFVPMPNLDEGRAALLEQGQLLPGTQLDSIYDYYRECGWSDPKPSGEPVEDLGQETVREELRADGSPWRVTYRVARSEDRVYDYLRSDGSTYLRVPHFSFADPSSWPTRIEKVSPEGEVVGRFRSLGQWFRGYVREVAGDERAFVFLETRVLTPHLVPIGAANIHLVQVMHNIHTRAPQRWDSPVVPLSQMLLDRINDLDAVVNLTERQREDIALRRGATNNMFVVPNPVVMPSAAEPASRDPRLVTIVARLSGQKRLPHAISAFERVLQSLSDARLEIFGDGPDRWMLRQLVESRGLQDSVILRGYDPQARETLSRSSAFLMTSRNEGYPLSTLESMSHGCPVVSYDIKYGPRDQITDGVDGFLVPDGDIELMAKRVVELLTTPALVARLGEGAVAKARQHNLARYARDWAEVLKTVAEQKDSRVTLKSGRLETTRLEVSRAGLLGRLTSRWTASPVGVHDDAAVLVFDAVLQVEGSGAPGAWGQARVELAAVQEVSGEVKDLPVTVVRDGKTFRLSAEASLASLFGGMAAGESVYLRVRFVCQNVAWETRVSRPAGGHSLVEAAFLSDETLLIQRPRPAAMTRTAAAAQSAS